MPAKRKAQAQTQADEISGEDEIAEVTLLATLEPTADKAVEKKKQELQKQLEAKRRKIEADYHRKAEAVRQQARTGINEQGKRINDAQRKQVNQLAKSIARRDEKHQAIAGKLRSLKDDLEQLLKKLGIAYNELMKRAGEPLPVAPVVVPGDQGGKQNDLR